MAKTNFGKWSVGLIFAMFVSFIIISFLTNTLNESAPTGVTVMIPGRTGCFDCAKNFRAEWKQLFTLVRARHGNNYVPTTTFSPFISLCSNIMAIEIFKIVTGFAEPMNRIFIDPITWKIDINKNYLERRTDCETCCKYWR